MFFSYVLAVLTSPVLGEQRELSLEVFRVRVGWGFEQHVKGVSAHGGGVGGTGWSLKVCSS